MKTRSRIPIFAGLALLAVLPAHAQTTVTVDNLRVWQHNDMSSRFAGLASVGVLSVQPGAAFPSGNAGPVSSADMRIEGLDLDGQGLADDHIDFSLRFEAARAVNPQTTWSGAGIGVNGDFLTPDEELTVSVVITDVSSGWATFDGFSAATVYLGGNGIVTNGQIEVNGETVSITNDYTGMGFMWENRETPIVGSPATVVLGNTQASDGDFRFRAVDFTITHDPDGTRPPPPPVVLTTNDLNLRPDPTFFVYPLQGMANQGGTNAGSIVAQPDFDHTMIAGANVIDFPLRWEGLNLDRGASDDDYVDFTLRATAVGSESFVTFTGEGIGIAGGTPGLDGNEQLLFEVVDIALSPGTAPGSVVFGGFSEAGFFASGFAEEGGTSGDAQCNVNGETVMIGLDGEGYAFGTVRATLGLAETVLFDMAAYSPGTVVPVGRARDFDLQLSYQESLEAPPRFEITHFSYDVVTSEVSVTWTSTPGEMYTLHFTESLQGSEGDFGDDFEANAEGDTTTISLTVPDPVPADLFLFVEKAE